MKKFITSAFIIGFITSNCAYAETQDLLTLGWEDLVPASAVVKNPIDELSKEDYYALTDDQYQNLMEEYQTNLEQSMATAPIVSELDGKKVTLAGYAVPLDFEAETVHEFLLVPYFGACIHVPPPPRNQTVYVQIENGTDLEGLWEAITVTGEMETTRISTDLAEAGYKIQASNVAPYTEFQPD